MSKAISEIKTVTAVAVALLMAFTLTACGSGGGISGGASDKEVEVARGGSATSGHLKIASWTLYIDNKTIPDFEAASGIDTSYNEEINDNIEFFGKIQPQLAQGDSGGRDILVVTDWMAKKLYDLGYLQKLDKSKIPNVEKNLIPSLRHPSFDPDRSFTVPWQSGMVGILVRKDLAPNIDSVDDMFDPKYRGKVTFLTEMRDTIPVLLKSEGIDPDEATTEDWMNAIEKLRENVENGQIRRFTGGDYVQDVVKGDVVAALGWSGDAALLPAENENIQYVQPKDGCSIFADNMVIPVGAPNPEGAYAFMNYIYDPQNQAQITEYVNYLSPVLGVKEIIKKRNPDLAKNELVFPSDEFLDNCSTQVSPPGDEDDVKRVEEAWEGLLVG